VLSKQTSLLRALSPTTPTILCPAMNTHMYQHPLTADHLRVVQDKLGYMVSGPQGAGILACGDEGERCANPQAATRMRYVWSLHLKVPAK
jgi:phosphopantothenoylcysteine synthetase/decarboxylase